MHGSFAHDLQRYGPERTYAPLSASQAQTYCARLARSHYENFTVASLLLPRRLLRHFHAVYAYCRWADDLADEAGGGDRALTLLQWWREELLLCYNGNPRHPVMIALQSTVRRFAIPQQPFLDLLSAFEQDQRTTRYRTFAELHDYCRRSADPVGRLILYLGEAYSPQRAALSDCICTGLQLTNFWQDVARDLDLGRVYLPAEDRDRFGYTEDDLQTRRFTPAFAALLRFQVDRARDFFQRGAALLDDVPPALRSDVELFLHGGLSVLSKIERAGYDVWSRRPVLARWEKAALLFGAVWRRLRGALRLW
jgi:squalene synthase HpnC